jgi:hypothetical protein
MCLSTKSYWKWLTLTLAPIDDHQELVREFANGKSRFNDSDGEIDSFKISSVTDSDSLFHGESERCGEMEVILCLLKYFGTKFK